MDVQEIHLRAIPSSCIILSYFTVGRWVCQVYYSVRFFLRFRKKNMEGARAQEKGIPLFSVAR